MRGLPTRSPIVHIFLSVGTTVTTRIIMHEKLRGTRCTAGTYIIHNTYYIYNIHSTYIYM